MSDTPTKIDTMPRPSRDFVEAWKPTVEAPLDFGAWVRQTFIEGDGALVNEDHAVLEHAEIGFLWTGFTYLTKGRRILGEARLAEPAKTNKWSYARQAQQIREWFGHIPDFIITLDAGFILEASAPEICAVVEHELYHCRQQVDAYGMPMYTADGFPKWGIAPHDVEEFTGVVRRYGAEAAHVKEFVDAANEGPTVARVDIEGVCGSCLKKVA